jgi:hypothetical protein
VTEATPRDDKITPIRAAMRNAPEARRKNGGGLLPDDCQVVALGTDGQVNYYLNAGGIFCAVPIKQHSKHVVRGLFAPNEAYLRKHWPKTSKEGTTTDFRPDDVAGALINACAVEGAWSGEDRLRGTGAWAGEDDDLVVHLGATLMTAGATERPGARGRFIYPVRPSRPGPAREYQADGPDGPGQELLGLLSQWHWRRPNIDPILLTGWISVAFLCGALRWRPQGWIAGERGSGKSTLMGVIAALLHRGDYCKLVADASAPSIRAALQHDAVPVLHDEAEPSEEMGRLNAKVELMRLAASGGLVMRATTDQQVITQAARFMGLFASVLRPPLKAQDASRIVFLDMKRVTSGRPPTISEDELAMLGRRVFRRMMDRWHAFQEELPQWREALMAAGMDARQADQYGTLLTAQDVLRHDASSDSDTRAELVAMVVDATRSERAEERPEWRWCIDHLTSVLMPGYKSGEQRSVGTVIAIAAGRQVLADAESGEPRRPFRGERDDANRVLQSIGLRFEAMTVNGRAMDDPDTHNPLGWLAVANSHAGLASIFRDTHWKPRSGAAGGWKSAIESADGAILGKPLRFGGTMSRCTKIPLDLVLDGENEGGE